MRTLSSFAFFCWYRLWADTGRKVMSYRLWADTGRKVMSTNMKPIILMLQGKELGADGEADDVAYRHVLSLEE